MKQKKWNQKNGIREKYQRGSQIGQKKLDLANILEPNAPMN